LRAVAWGGNVFVAAGDGDALVTSTDGANWRTIPLPSTDPGVHYEIQSVAWSGRQFVAVGNIMFGEGEGGMLHGSPSVTLTSPDGLDWKTRTGDTKELADEVIWAGDQFIAHGIDGDIFTSPDGAAWKLHPAQTSSVTIMSRLAWNGRRLVVVSMGDAILSADAPTAAPGAPSGNK
jgi:hypothetical protein